jgi:hypothetical protein
MNSEIKTAATNKAERKQRGRIDRSAMFPVAPPKVELPEDYANWLAELKYQIQSERLRIVISSNVAMVLLYWEIGHRIYEGFCVSLA